MMSRLGPYELGPGGEHAFYLLGPGGWGAARTQSLTLARDYEMTGYHRCTRKKFLQRIREMRAHEALVLETQAALELVAMETDL